MPAIASRQSTLMSLRYRHRGQARSHRIMDWLFKTPFYLDYVHVGVKGFSFARNDLLRLAIAFIRVVRIRLVSSGIIVVRTTALPLVTGLGFGLGDHQA